MVKVYFVSLVLFSWAAIASEDSECIHSEEVRKASIATVIEPLVLEVKGGVSYAEVLRKFEAIQLPRILEDDGILYVGREGYFKGETIGIEFTCITKRVGCGAEYSACAGMFAGGPIKCKKSELLCEVEH